MVRFPPPPQNRTMRFPPPPLRIPNSVRSVESCRTKIPRIFRIFVPNFAPNFAPNPRIFLRTFRASFRGRRKPEKIHPKSPPFFNANFPGKHKENIHKILLESRQSKEFLRRSGLRVFEGVSERVSERPFGDP